MTDSSSRHQKEVGWLAPLLVGEAKEGGVRRTHLLGSSFGTIGIAVVVVASLARLDATERAVLVVAGSAAILLGLFVLIQPFSARATDRMHDDAAALAATGSELAIGVSVIGEDLSYLNVNPCFCQMLGRRREDLIGHEVSEFLAPADVEAFRAHAVALLSGSGSSTTLEQRLIRADGEDVYALATSATIRHPTDRWRYLVTFVHDVTEQHNIIDQQAELAQLLIRAQEDERRRIADEVHDDPLQSLIALSMQLQVLESRTSEPGVLDIAADIKQSVAQAIDQMRSLLFELHPPALHLGGLSESLVEYIRRYQHSGKPEVRFEDGLSREPEEEQGIVLFRITTEALTNARKHAAAQLVSITLADSQGGISLSVTDDGVGFSDDTALRAPGHLGVVSMRERAERAGGSFEIASKPGSGTTVRAWIPRGA